MKCQSHHDAIQSSVKHTILSDKDTYMLERVHHIQQNVHYSHDMKKSTRNTSKG